MAARTARSRQIVRLLPVFVCIVAGLAACGSDSSLSDIEVTGDDKPEISVDEGFELDTTASTVLQEGDGEQVHTGDVVMLHYVGVDGRTASVFDDTYQQQQPLTATLASGEVLDGFIKGLDGETVGSRVLVAIAPEDGVDQRNEQADVDPDDTLIFVFDIEKKIPDQASGDTQSLPDSVPELTFDDDDHPDGFSPTGETKDDVSDEHAYTAIKGDGEKISSGQSLVVQYVGQVYPDGEVFDESWSQGPATFDIDTGRLIECWDDLLVGQTVGSRVILVCPAEYAYGEEGTEAVEGGDTLIFAIDLLAAN